MKTRTHAQFLVSFLVVSVVLVPAVETVKEKRSCLFNIQSRNLLFLDYLLFEVSANSLRACVVLCARQTCCAYATYQHAMNTCRGHHSTDLLSMTNSGSTAFVKQYGSTYGTLRNEALLKSAQQSTTEYGQIADLAIDGNNNWDNNNVFTCSLTMKVPDQRSWWQVDLGAQYDVCYLVITNRGGAVCASLHYCANRLRDFDIHVFKEDPIYNPSAAATLCHHYDGVMALAVTETVVCDQAPATGRYVRITNVLDEYLNICEVEVMAVPLI